MFSIAEIFSLYHLIMDGSLICWSNPQTTYFHIPAIHPGKCCMHIWVGEKPKFLKVHHQQESLKENLRAAVLTRLLAELPGCVSGCRKMLQLAYCDRALIFSLWWITLGSHSWGCAGLGCTMQTCSRKESALTNEENSKKKTRSGSSLIVNGVT